MLIKILIAVVVILVVFVIVVAMRPEDFRVTRSATISAPVSAVFAQVNDYHKWEAWSPWAKMDPNAKTTFEGSDAGVGATFHWDGNSKVGTGGMTITESKPDELIRMRLEFLRPFKATNMAEFTFTPQGNQTVMTWSMSGKNNFMGKAFSLFVNCDKMVGGEFEKGLANIKSVVETPTR